MRRFRGEKTNDFEAAGSADAEQIALGVIDRLLDETRRAKNAAKVPFSTAQWFRFTLAHQRRHLWQAREVRNHPRFPVQ